MASAAGPRAGAAGAHTAAGARIVVTRTADCGLRGRRAAAARIMRTVRAYRRLRCGRRYGSAHARILVAVIADDALSQRRVLRALRRCGQNRFRNERQIQDIDAAVSIQIIAGLLRLRQRRRPGQSPGQLDDVDQRVGAAGCQGADGHRQLHQQTDNQSKNNAFPSSDHLIHLQK